MDMECIGRPQFLGNTFVSEKHVAIATNMSQEKHWWKCVSTSKPVIIYHQNGEKTTLQPLQGSSEEFEEVQIEDGDVCILTAAPGMEAEVRVLNPLTPIPSTQAEPVGRVEEEQGEETTPTQQELAETRVGPDTYCYIW